MQVSQSRLTAGREMYGEGGGARKAGAPSQSSRLLSRVLGWDSHLKVLFAGRWTE